MRYAALTVAGLVPSAAASARTVGRASPDSTRPDRIEASALPAISRAVRPLIWYCARSSKYLYYNKSPVTSSLKTPRTSVRRRSGRGKYDRPTVHAILDEGLMGHVGIVTEGQPYAMPMLYARADEVLYLHGAPLSRLLKGLADGIPMCLTVTLVDGLVLARSAFHSSVNYRSVLVIGRGRAIRDRDEKLAALDTLVEHMAPGRTREARGPSPQELRATEVIELPIDEASAKIRTGPPADAARDYALPIWAGELPLGLAVGERPVSDERCSVPGVGLGARMEPGPRLRAHAGVVAPRQIGPGRSLRSRVPMPKFELDAAYNPTADQPAAIEGLAEGIGAGERYMTLLGATGTGKTMTMAATIEAVQKPSLVIAHNKTLGPSSATSSGPTFPATRSSTSSPTTTTTSPRPTFRARTSTSRRTRRSTRRSTGFATRRRRRCSPGATC